MTSGVVDNLPTGSLPTVISTSFTTMVALMNVFTFVVPVGNLLLAAAFVFVVDHASMIWYLLNWLLKKIPGVS